MNINRSRSVLLFGCIIWFVYGSFAWGQEQEYKWGLGLLGGFASFTGEISDVNDLEGEIGGLFSASAMTQLNKYISYGLGVEWNRHKLTRGTLSFGNASTVFLSVPFEFHLGRARQVSPYAFLSSGYVVNLFKESDSFKAAYGDQAHIEVANSLAIKTGLGLEMFLLSDHIAFNVEVGFRYSIGEMKIYGTTFRSSDDFYNNIVFIQFGCRYYLPEPFFP